MLRLKHPQLHTYVMAFLAVALATLLTLLLRSLIQPTFFLLFFAAVSFSAWYGGLRPGILATVLSVVVYIYFFVAPFHSWTIGWDDLIRLGLFVLVALWISSLSTQLRMEKRRVEMNLLKLQETEERYRSSQQLFESFMQNIPGTAYIKDTQGHYIYINPVGERVLNRTRTEIVGKTDFDLVPEAAAQQIHDYDRAVLSANKPIEALESLLLSESNQYWMSFKFPINDSSGKPLLAGMSFDITDRKHVEEALRRSEERFRIAQELSLDAFTVLRSVRDETGNIIDFEWTYVNPTAARVLHHTVEELVGQRLLQLLPGNPTNSDLFKHYMKVVETGEPHDLELHYKSEGIEGWFRNMAVKLEDGVAISFSDITRRKRQEAERLELLERERTARAEAETANRVKDEFLAVLSHELRSPLNPILGWSKLLRTRSYDQATQERALEIIERNAKLQTQLIEELLDVSRILRGKLSLNPSPVHLQSTIEGAIETVRLAASAKCIQIETAWELDHGQVWGDANRLQQVVWNLLSNAVKFTPAGGRVEIRLRQSGKQAVIQVSDTGKGISPDFLPFVFDRFRQENSTTTRAFGGLGLGLAIVHHLVKLHGGTVGVASAGVGQGTTFTVMLPLRNLEIIPQTKDGLSLDSPNLEGVRLLVVDDEEDTRDLLVFSLGQYGAQVTAVATAAEALRVLAQSQPDVLLSDIGMPEVDGYMLMRHIRSLPPEQGGKIRAIAVTAYAGEADHQQILVAGFQGHITKPIDPAELAKAITSVVGHTAQKV
ncbi:MAG TPA: ATP-binding protein [Stenomitos sp.]